MSNFRRLGIITPSTASDLTGFFPDEMKVRNVGNINSGTLGIANGGTGLSSTPTNGQLLIGSGSSYSLSTLTAGDNITITNGSGTITIAATGGGGSGDVEAVNAGTNLTGGGLSGSVTLNLADTISLSAVTASFSGSGANITSITASNISNFTTDVRAQFTAGTNITITNGQISSTGGSGGVTAITSSNSNLTFSPISGSVTGSLSANLSVTSITASSGFSGNLTGVATTARFGISQFTVASTTGLTTGSLVCLAIGTNSPLAIATKTTDSGSNAIGIIDAINGTTVDVMYSGERLINENVSAQTIGTPLYVGNSGATAIYSAISSGEYATKVGYVSVSGSGAGTGKMFIQIHPFGQIN